MEIELIEIYEIWHIRGVKNTMISLIEDLGRQIWGGATCAKWCGIANH